MSDNKNFKRLIYGDKLSEIEKDFIHRNAKSTTAKDLAEVLGHSYGTIADYCRKVGLERKWQREPASEKAKSKPDETIGRIVKEAKEAAKIKTITRPPAKYNNRSQDEAINYYLNLKV